MARALLDGYPVGRLQTQFPTIALMLDQVLPEFADEQAGRLAVANAVALQLGWRLFEPFLRSAAGLSEVPDATVQASAAAAAARILTPD